MVPSNAVLAGVYARRTVVELRPNWAKGFKWHLITAVYQLYFRLRLDREELTDGFLKTPSRREKGCERLVYPDGQVAGVTVN